MTMLSYPVHISVSGEVSPIPDWLGGEVDAKIYIERPQKKYEDEQPFDDWPTPTDEQLEKMYTMCRGCLEGMTQDDFDQLREERIKRETAEHTRIAEQTPEEWQAAVDDFMTSWKGCLKGVPHMTAKEIRAERLERKYGQHGRNE